MKVIPKTFAGGYKFKNFEGQPTKSIKTFQPTSDVTDLVLKPEECQTAADVLKALELTTFDGPASAIVATEGNIEPKQVKNIIISAVEVEPYDLPGEFVLSNQHMVRFVDGLKALKESYAQAKVSLVVANDQTALEKLLTPIADNLSWLEVYTITAKYPANLKELLIPTLFDTTYPVGYAPAHIGYLFLSVTDVLVVEKLVMEKKNAINTIVALSGPGWKENIIIEVPVGTVVSDIVDKYLEIDEMRLIKNSVITGDILSKDDLVTYDLNTLIALPEDRRRQTLFFLRAGKNSDSFSNSFLAKLLPNAEKTAGTNLQGERRACVSCTYCQNVCPVGLIPHLLHKHVDKEIYNERLAEYKIFDCVECGLCDYVCPSKIEVSSNIKKGKIELEKNDISHNKYVIPQCDMVLEPVVSDVTIEPDEEVAANE